jgi:hypothetical protein
LKLLQELGEVIYLPGREIKTALSSRAARDRMTMDGASEVYDGEGVVILDPFWINQVNLTLIFFLPGPLLLPFSLPLNPLQVFSDLIHNHTGLNYNHGVVDINGLKRKLWSRETPRVQNELIKLLIAFEVGSILPC